MSDNGQNFEEVRAYNKNKIKFFDPMFLMDNAITKDIAECREFNGVTSKKYGDGVKLNFLQPGTEVEHKIRINFST